METCFLSWYELQKKLLLSGNKRHINFCIRGMTYLVLLQSKVSILLSMCGCCLTTFNAIKTQSTYAENMQRFLVRVVNIL